MSKSWWDAVYEGLSVLPPHHPRKQLWSTDGTNVPSSPSQPWTPVLCNVTFSSSLPVVEMTSPSLGSWLALWLALATWLQQKWWCTSSEIRPKKAPWTSQTWLTCQLPTDTWESPAESGLDSMTAQSIHGLLRNNTYCFVSLNLRRCVIEQ